MRAVAAILNIEQMAVTTGEVLSSPATVRIKVSRALDVALELHPDPAHGEVGDPSTAIWPTIATRYLATLEYQDGTNFQLKGPMPETSSSQPLPLRFVDVPAGGQFRITAGLFSASGWLAGAWQSDWIKAEPNQGTTLDLGKKNITENLVPLAPDTQYVYKEQIAYANGEFVWKVGAPATVAPLDCGDSGTLCDLVGMTLNNSAFQVGYAWRASGQDLKPDSSSARPSNEQLYAVQNLSVLADPSSRLISTDIGFTQRPQIAYAPSTARGDQIDQNNFVLDPRGGGMNLRRVRLSEGQTDFGLGDADQPSWGRFPLQNLDALAVHPSNSVIGASFKDQKLMLLPLPAEGTTDDKAPEAVMVSGKGIRQGLMNGPKALAVAPDGRILVLESANRRVQAFDLKGNPVPSFTWMPTLFTVDTAAVAADLDRGEVPPVFIDELVESASTFELVLAESLAASLDTGRFEPENDPVIGALAAKGIELAYDREAMSDPALSAQLEVVEKGRVWTITDPRGQAWRLVDDEGAISVYGIPARATVTVQTEGRRWLISDRFLGTSWQLSPSTADESRTLVDVSLSYFPLNANLVRAPEYLDMAVEAEGHVYVLLRTGGGTADEDYVLDIYSPQGKLVSRTPDPSVTSSPQNLVAARIAVDIWRNLYGLGYGRLAGHPRVQPDLAHWVPTPPLFSLPLSVQKDLNDQNISAVAQAFAARGVVLSNQAFITVVDPEGTWEVKDGSTIYHLYRSGDGLQVYSIPA
ncbi:MAG: hypothetical protein R3190_09275, partial [Thermoanaerobaculia bacterium]|nr:hypothetical protein [Thermoanaerobaculia bacterium]